MTLIREHENPAQNAPSISFNHCGAMPWSGKHESAFTGVELVELLKICEKEANRQGRLDAFYDRVGSREISPFNPAFMGGYPKRLWEAAYWTGVQEPGESTPEAIELEIETALADPSTSNWLRGALASALPRDPVNALEDAEYLSDVLCRRFRMMVEGLSNARISEVNP